MKRVRPGKTGCIESRGRAIAVSLRLGTVVVFVGVTLLNLDALIVQLCNPTVPVAAIARDPPADASDGRRRLGRCWRSQLRGQHVMYLAGDPQTLGYCNSQLAGDLMALQERALFSALERFVPSAAVQHVLLRGLIWTYRGIADQLTDAQRLEVHGMARGYRDPHRHLGPTYPRLLYYHAIHDISQALVDNPLLACSAFAASGRATVSGRTILARVFDFEGGEVFDRDKVVLFYQPDYGLSFVSVAWAGMTGVVSGMNQAGLGVVLNAAASDDTATRGMPTTLLVREILQHATSVNHALSLIRRRRVFVSDILTMADTSGRMVVVELTPKRIAVRQAPARDPVIFATNHLLGETFAADQANGKRLRDGTTASRYAQLGRSLGRAAGKIDVGLAQRVLRNRTVGERAIERLGHRGAIDALIATHAVIFDLDRRVLWVSKAPHTLGAFVEYRLAEVLSGTLRDHGALAADPLLKNGGWARYKKGRALLDRAAHLADPEQALTLTRRAVALTPHYPPALRQLGRLCQQTGDRKCARAAYRAFLANNPPHRKHAHAIEKLLRAAERDR